MHLALTKEPLSFTLTYRSEAMLKLDGITIQGNDKRILLQNATFLLPESGFTSIHSDTSELHHMLAQILAGIQKPRAGTLNYNGCEMHTFCEEERSLYRSTFVVSLFHEFQVLKESSVYENITMGLEYPIEKINEELRNWNMYEKRDVLAEDLSTQEQWRMVLLRYVLRQPMMLVFDSSSSPLARQERWILYELLIQLSKNMQIVVIGDLESYPFSNRIIEIEKGYILSDSYQKQKIFPQINHSNEGFQLTRANVDSLYDEVHSFIRWKLRCASLLCIVAFICLSTAIFSTTLNIIDIQMRLMKKQNVSLVAIEKQAMQKDGEVMDNYYDYLNQKDVQTMERHLQGNLTLGYSFADSKEARLYSYGIGDMEKPNRSLDDFTVLEADSGKALGFQKMYGHYPKNDHEVALSSYQAYRLLQNTLHEPFRNSKEQIEKMLHKKVEWYGNILTISAIFPSQSDANSNMEMDMTGYNGNAYMNGSIMENSFLVKTGFTKQYSVMKSEAYQRSYKRFIYRTKNVFDFDGLRALDSDVYYYDQEGFQNDHKLAKNEVLLDYQTAMDLGFRAIYAQQLQDKQGDNKKNMQRSYIQFIKKWIGKEITLQTYTVANAPASSKLMNKTVKIKGFLFPLSFDQDDYKTYYRDAQGKGSIYANPSLLQPYMHKNIYIKEAFYHSDHDKKMQAALTYLNQKDAYSAYLTNSRILKFFVVDLKEITSFLCITGFIGLIGYCGIIVFLLWASIAYLRNETTIFYLFGERESILKRMIRKYFIMVAWTRSIFGWFCGTLALGILVLMIRYMLASSSYILWSLLLPAILLVLCMIIGHIAFYVVMRRSHVIEEEFHDPM